MEPTISIPVTFTVFENLCKFLDGSTVSEEVAEVASKAITAWIEQQSLPLPEEPSGPARRISMEACIPARGNQTAHRRQAQDIPCLGGRRPNHFQRSSDFASMSGQSTCLDKAQCMETHLASPAR
ncbi:MULTISPECIES: hypothetical protein [unclassified Duganella]|uniref:hypothetical protein n=1 Tax=unclassified Duganella TaxID=2636909 RepID=UPI000A9A842A|nr:MULTISPECIES: hypothetical protein [unclassified Duganella]